MNRVSLFLTEREAPLTSGSGWDRAVEAGEKLTGGGMGADHEGVTALHLPSQWGTLPSLGPPAPSMALRSGHVVQKMTRAEEEEALYAALKRDLEEAWRQIRREWEW